MVAKKVEALGGMIPAVDQNLLPDTQAALAQNTWMYSGAIAGMNSPTAIKTLQTSTSKIFRIPTNFTDTTHLNDAAFIEFGNIDTDVLRSQVVGETFDRYYFASPVGVPTYNTSTRMKAGNTGANAPFTLGIPAPGVAPTVSLSGSGGSARTSSYVYTWVSAYGEEGPPSPPLIAQTGTANQTWGVTVGAAAANDINATTRNLTKVRIYRTATSVTGTATFFLLVEQAIGSLTYNDVVQDSTLSQNNSLVSTNWSSPPTDLQGFVAMPNGIFAGFRANEIWFCEPYRAHAWPALYALAVDFPVVGLGVVGQTLVVCTQSYAFAISGIHPAVMSQSRMAALEPCLSRGSVVSSPEGVYYASPNGLMLVANGSITNITRDMVTRDKWNQLLNTVTVATLRAGKLAGSYYCWGSSRPGVFQTDTWQVSFTQQADFTGAINGAFIDVHNQRVAFTSLSNLNPITNVQNDPWTGEMFLLRNDPNNSNANTLYWINVGDSAPTYETYKWRSRIWQFPKPENIGVIKVYFDVPSTSPALNPVPNASPVQTLAADQWGLVRMYADGVLKWTRELRTTGALMRLPTGFKCNYVQFEFESRLYIKSFQFASSAKELAGV